MSRPEDCRLCHQASWSAWKFLFSMSPLSDVKLTSLIKSTPKFSLIDFHGLHWTIRNAPRNSRTPRELTRRRVFISGLRDLYLYAREYKYLTNLNQLSAFVWFEISFQTPENTAGQCDTSPLNSATKLAKWEILDLYPGP